MSEIQDLKCPCCGGAIEFDSGTQKMKCPYCDSELEPEALAAYAGELSVQQEDSMSWGTSEGTEWTEEDKEDLRVYVCSSCGGQIVGDKVAAAASCPFCGNPVVFKSQLSGELKPDLVIPFKLDKKAAKEALKKHYLGKRLLPKVFKDQNHIDEVKGMYVPFWIFDTDSEADVRYRAKKVRFWSDDDNNYVEDTYYSVIRGGALSFKGVPVDGSTKMADDLMESLEPFDFSEAVDFRTAYLAGYLADKYDVDRDKCILRANERIKRSTEEAFAATVEGYSSVFTEHSSVRFNNAEAKYALLPVWVLNTTWKGERYTFAMNGQTGKFVGDLPLDKGARKRWLWGITAAVGAAWFVLSYLIWLI